MSTPTTENALLPFLSGTMIWNPVTLFHVTGYSTPLMSTVLTFTGAVPVRMAVLLFRPTGLRLKLDAFSAANWAAILLRAPLSQPLILVAGFSTNWPFATKVAYLASISGPLLAIL